MKMGAVDKRSSGVRVWVVEEVTDVRGSRDDVDCGGWPYRGQGRGLSLIDEEERIGVVEKEEEGGVW